MHMSGFAILWIVLAIINILYGIMIRMIGSGTGFFLVWIALGIGCLLLAGAAQLHLWNLLPKALKIPAVSICCIGLAVVIFLTGCIRTSFKEQGEPGLDVIVVLGAQLHSYGPSAVLEYRLEAAEKYLKENSETRCIVTGGQGYNEPTTEAEGMKTWLLEHGIEEDRIIMEDRSVNTLTNITNSMAIMETWENHSLRIGIVTNNFHLYRAMHIAQKQGMQDVCGIAAYSTPRYLPNNMLREILGIIKDTLAGNM